MFCNNQNKTELFFLFKNTGIAKIENKPFSTNAIHKQFEDVSNLYVVRKKIYFQKSQHFDNENIF